MPPSPSHTEHAISPSASFFAPKKPVYHYIKFVELVPPMNVHELFDVRIVVKLGDEKIFKTVKMKNIRVAYFFRESMKKTAFLLPAGFESKPIKFQVRWTVKRQLQRNQRSYLI